MPNMKNKISVIVPVYNASATLKRCIDSVLSQTYSGFELILVDDGSRDESGLICDSYSKQDDRIIVIHKTNGGVSSARNRGIDTSSGDLITFVDSDDWLASNALEVMLNILIKEDVDCVRTMYHQNYVNGDQKTFSLKNNEGKYEGREVLSLIDDFVTGREFCYTVLLLVKRNLIKNIGRFNTEIHMMEDTVFYVRMLTTVKSIYLSNTPTYHYFQNSQSASKSSQKYVENMRSVMKVNAEIKDYLSSQAELTNDLEVKINQTHLVFMANYLFKMFMNGASRTDILSFFNMLRKDDAYIKLLNETDISTITLHLRFSLERLADGNFNQLYGFFYLRRLMNYLKGLK